MPKLLGFLFCALFAIPSGAMTVDTESGPVKGVEEDGAVVFKGLPYAAPPVGDLRWRAPQRPAHWEGVRIADTYSPSCPQKGAYPTDQPAVSTSEDCLTLNLWRPVGNAAASLPVLVWIHGGGLLAGSGSLSVYRGDQWARRGIILVTINYRLGVFGFLAHPELTREATYHASGNYGLLDQIAALEWIQRNIAGFGGDPRRVTIAGQSAGSNAISVLAASKRAEGLFQRIIGQSGGMFEPMEMVAGFRLDGAEQDGKAFARRAGAESIEALRAMPAADLAKLSFDPRPILDRHLLMEPPYDAYRRGHANRAAILLGYDEGDGLPFLAGRKIGAGNLRDELGMDFPPLLVRLLGPGRVADDSEARTAAARFEGDMRFRWDMWKWARMASEAEIPVYFYRFASGPAEHGAELPSVFGHGETRVFDNWANFVIGGDPNGQGLPAWPRFSPDRPQLMTLNETARAEPVPEEAALWRIDRVYRFPRIVFRWWKALF